MRIITNKGTFWCNWFLTLLSQCDVAFPVLDRLPIWASLLLGYCGPFTAAELSDVEFDEGNVGEKVGCRISFGRTGDSGSVTGIAGVKSPGI